MKSKDVKIGQEFECLNIRVVRTPEFYTENRFNSEREKHNGIALFSNGNNAAIWVDPDTEVKLITKCSNCKHYRPNIDKPEYQMYYCEATVKHKSIPVHGSDSAEVVLIEQDSEIFYCKHFNPKLTD